MRKSAEHRSCWSLCSALFVFFLFFSSVSAVSAQTVYFKDDFEHGLGNWVVSGKDWAVTTEDFRSGTHCVTDSPNRDYQDNSDVRIRFANALDLSGATSPQLTFWHRYSIQNWNWHSDWADVYLSQDGGANWTWLNHFAGVSSTWWQFRVDLTAYKSKPVTIMFRINSDGSETSDGWYIDDVEIREKDSSPELSVSVEPSGGGTVTGGAISCPGNCTANYPFNWVVSGKDWALTTEDARSGSHCITDSPKGEYPNDADVRIMMAKSINLSAAVSPQLTFWHKYSIQNWNWHSDWGDVYISQDGGATWTFLTHFAGVVSTWTEAIVDLKPYKSKPILIMLRIVSDGSETSDGWYVDDVQIKDASTSVSYFFDNFESSNSMPSKAVLAAAPSSGFAFSSWSGCDATSGNQCTVSYNIARNVKATFTGSGNTPSKATLVSPSGTIGTSTPTYTWNAVSNSDWYYLLVKDSTATNKVATWYTAGQVGCSSGTGTCSVTPATALAAGAGQWSVQTWNNFGYGPWSDIMTFTVSVGGPPGKATLISPSGSISTATPTYVWNAVSGATWYYLWVKDSDAATSKIATWYTAAQAGCGSGTGNCSITPTAVLASGPAMWWIETWNEAGSGPWSDGMSFTVSLEGPPGKATLVSPSGPVSTATPTYTWNAVGGATWYCLWVKDSSFFTFRINTWYTAAQADCASGIGVCKITPMVPLVSGAAQWWIQTWNPKGYGPWSDPMSFTIP